MAIPKSTDKKEEGESAHAERFLDEVQGEGSKAKILGFYYAHTQKSLWNHFRLES